MTQTSRAVDPATVLSRIGHCHLGDSLLRPLLVLFPVPSPGYALLLVQAVGRIASSTPWLDDALGLPELTPGLRELEQALVGSYNLHGLEHAAQLTGEFLFARSLVGREFEPAPGPEALRASLLVCGLHWLRNGNTGTTSATRALGTAIRGVTENYGRSGSRADARHVAGSKIRPHLHSLGESADLVNFINASRVIETFDDELADAWTRHFGPTLREISGGLSDEKRVRGTARTGSRDPKASKEDEPEPPPRAVRLRPSHPSVEREPYEPPEETATAAFISVLPGARTNPDAKRLSRYVAQQAIWSENYLLVTQHPSVLPSAQFRHVTRILVEQLHAGAAPQELRMGLAGLLLQAITGRVSRQLPSLASRHREVQSHSCRLSLKDSTLEVEVAWRRRIDGDKNATGYFLPPPSTSHLFEQVETSFTLPLDSSIVNALSRSGALDTLGDARPAEVDESLRAAARYVSSLSDFPLTAGQVRRSFAAHLYEGCRDLALTQLISGDSLGQSEAPLHYYSPRRSDVAQAYHRFLRELLELESGLLANKTDAARIGASTLLLQRRAKRLAAVSGATLNTGIDPGKWQEVHRAIVAHVACMFMGVVGHRPVQALFRLTIADLYWSAEGGVALLRDKRHDPAHDPRFAVLPPSVARQLDAYLSHLQGIAAVEPSLAQHVQSVLEGNAPLLFDVATDGAVTALQLKELRALLPKEWREIPLNWGRTWIRTRAVESGLPPEWAAVQLGHLESTGYPFSNASPTVPAHVVGVIAPHLEAMVRQLGWRVRTGVQCLSPAKGLPLPGLRHWSNHVAAHEAQARAQMAAARATRQASIAAYREQAAETVLTHPTIRNRKLDTVFQDSVGPWSGDPLSRVEADALRDALVEAAGDDLALAVANARALHRILRLVNTRLGVQGQEPRAIDHFRRPVDNAFVPQMMHAVRQVVALRAHAGRLGSRPPGKGGFHHACARVAYVLAVFGFIDDVEQILGAITYRTSLEAPARLSDVVLVPWGECPGQLLALRNLAAICFARFARRHPDPSIPAPDRSALSRALAELLPPWANCGPETDALGRLCETVRVANRFELSPAARFALDPTAGAVNATMAEQLALIDGDPVGGVERPPIEAETPRGQSAGEMSSGGVGNARSQYLELCRVLPRANRELVLKRTGRRIPAELLVHASTRAAVIAEVDAFLADRRPSATPRPIVRMLATWVRHMLIEGTPGTRTPSDRTIETYLTRIGGTLVEALGSGSLEDLDDVELEEAYLAAIFSGTSNRAQAAASVLAFDACTRRRFDLPDADLTEVRAYAGGSTRTVDAELILPNERIAILEHAIQRAEVADAPTPEGVRILRQAAAALPLYAWGGMRRAEVMGMRIRDVWVRDGTAAVQVRRNRSRRLKSAAARRTLLLDGDLPGLQEFGSWVDTDGRRSPAWQRPLSYAFSHLAQPRGAEGRDAIAAACMELMRHVTGRPRERLHRLRHLVAFERTLPVVLSTADLAWMESAGLTGAPGGVNEAALPRDLMERIALLGHRDWRTTIRSYIHMPWLWRSRSDERIARDYMSRREVALAMGVTLQAVDNVSQKAKPRTPRAAWLEHVRRPRKIRGVVREDTVRSGVLQHAWTAGELDALFKQTEHVGNLQEAVRISGGSAVDYANIAAGVTIIEHRIGGRLFRGVGPSPKRPRRVVRRLDPQFGGALLDWLDRSIRSGDSEVQALISNIVDALSPYDRPHVVAEAHAINQLVAHVQRLTSVRVIADVRPCENTMMRATFHNDAGTNLVGDIKRAFGTAWIALRLGAKPDGE